MQVNLPIKPKTNKTFYNYVVYRSATEIQYGRAEVLPTWKAMRDSIGVSEDCLVLGGKDGQEDMIEVETGD